MPHDTNGSVEFHIVLCPVRRQTSIKGSNRPPGGWCGTPHWRTERRCFAASATLSATPTRRPEVGGYLNAATRISNLSTDCPHDEFFASGYCNCTFQEFTSGKTLKIQRTTPAPPKEGNLGVLLR